MVMCSLHVGIGIDIASNLFSLVIIEAANNIFKEALYPHMTSIYILELPVEMEMPCSS